MNCFYRLLWICYDGSFVFFCLEFLFYRIENFYIILSYFIEIFIVKYFVKSNYLIFVGLWSVENSVCGCGVKFG